MNDVIKFLKNLDIYENDKIVLACSYGPDSMALLDILMKMNFDVIVAHVNHNLRSESFGEYKDLEKFCHENNIIFEGSSINETLKGNIEASFRKYRYDFFDKVVKKYNAKYLFTAHHGDDLIETILMRLVRGASLSGYAGFRMVSDNSSYKIVRPLIYLSKDDILKYVSDNNIKYAIDQSNFDIKYTRNRYRSKILPVLKEINPKVHNKFIKFSNNIVECADYIDKKCDDLFSELYVHKRIDLNKFYLLDSFIQRRILEKVLLSLYNDKINRITDKHIDLILSLVNSEKVNGVVNLPCNILVCKFYNILEFDYKNKIEDYEFIFNKEIALNDWVIKMVDSTDIVKSNYIFRLKLSDVQMPLIVRNRKVGDKISLKNGSKKIGEVFSEAKISKGERDLWPVLVDGKGRILWIPGVKKSKFDSKYNEDYDIIIKYIKKGEKDEK